MVDPKTYTVLARHSCLPPPSKLQANSFPPAPSIVHGWQYTYMDVLGKIARAISDALQDPGKLPGALIMCGVLEAAAALSLIFFRGPGGVFLHHGESLVYVYYGVLIVVVVFGLAEAAVGLWVSADPSGRQAIGKIIMGLSILPLIIIASLGGFSSAAPK